MDSADDYTGEDYENPYADEPETESAKPDTQEPSDDNTSSVDDDFLKEIGETQEQSESEQAQEKAPRSFKINYGDKELEYNINGDLSEDEIEDLRLGYLKDIDYKAKLGETTKKQQEFESRRGELDTALDYFYSQLVFDEQQFDTPEMQQLKEYDEDKYNRKWKQHVDRVNDYRHAHQAMQQQKQAENDQIMQQEMERITEVIPEWVDVKKRDSDLAEMEQYLSSIGVPKQEFASFADRAYKLKQTRDAMNWAKMQKDIAKNQDKRAPTTSKTKRLQSAKPAKTLLDYFRDEQ